MSDHRCCRRFYTELDPGCDKGIPAVGVVPEVGQRSHGGVVGDQPVPMLVGQHDGFVGAALVKASSGCDGSSGKVVGCGLDVGHDKGQWQNVVQILAADPYPDRGERL